VYGAGASAYHMEPPPHSLPLRSVSAPVAELFERAFRKPEPGTSRPSAMEWVAALDQFSRGLHQCKQEPTHHYHQVLHRCNWCEIEQKSGIFFFPASSAPATARLPDVARFRAMFASLSAPLPPRYAERKLAHTLQPTPIPSEVLKARSLARQLIAVAVGIAVLSSVVPYPGLLILVSVGLGLFAWRIHPAARLQDMRKRRALELQAAQTAVSAIPRRSHQLFIG
jgi:DNA-binding helix-hairpin-helix protein with protein kinase domain